MDKKTEAQYKREIRELRERLTDAKRVVRSVGVTAWKGMSDRFVQEIQTLERAGYTVEVTVGDAENVSTRAVRRIFV